MCSIPPLKILLLFLGMTLANQTSERPFQFALNGNSASSVLDLSKVPNQAVLHGLPATLIRLGLTSRSTISLHLKLGHTHLSPYATKTFKLGLSLLTIIVLFIYRKIQSISGLVLTQLVPTLRVTVWVNQLAGTGLQ